MEVCLVFGISSVVQFEKSWTQSPEKVFSPVYLFLNELTF